MNLNTTYMGMKFPHPLLPGSCPLSRDLDQVRRLEDAGAAAIVMWSLFEEQIVAEQTDAVESVDAHAESFGEALSYLPTPDKFHLGPDHYLEHLRRVKSAVAIPVIGSLNGTTTGGWLDYARLIQEAGADALELNTYLVATDPAISSMEIEKTIVEMVKTVKETVNIPVAAKLSGRFTSFPHFSKQLEEAGADGLVLFNRYYQPDIDVEDLEVKRRLNLSDSSELLPRLLWLAIVSGRTRMSLAASGGVHSATDAIKAVMSGAHAVQMVSALLLQGPNYLQKVRSEMIRWMEEHEYESLEQMQGSMNLMKCPDPKAFQRLNYVEVLQSWR